MTTLIGSLLAVDDDPDSLNLLEGLLKPLGHHIRCISQADAVIQALHQEPAELVLMDIQMPGINGIELCRQIQADHKLKGIPVIFVTARHDEVALANAYAAGGRDYLTKPFRKTDIQARIGTHLALHRAEQQLQQQLAFRDLMITMLSHDLRGPLGTAGIFIEQMIEGPFTQPELMARLALLKNSLNSTHQLLERTLDWARSIQHDLPFSPVWSDLKQLALQSLEAYRLKANEKNIILEVNVSDGLLALLDPDLIRTSLLNLINNALKYTTEGGKVTLTAEFGDSEFRLSVNDTGTGMSSEQIFALEQQQNINSLAGTQGEKGSGLGIKICQQLAARHGGQLQIVSQLGKGSCFTLVLPGSVRFTV